MDVGLRLLMATFSLKVDLLANLKSMETTVTAVVHPKSRTYHNVGADRTMGVLCISLYVQYIVILT